MSIPINKKTLARGRLTVELYSSFWLACNVSPKI